MIQLNLKIIIIVVFGFSFTLLSQIPPDSLFLKIGFFKYLVDDHPKHLKDSVLAYVKNETYRYGFPGGTHFFFKHDSFPELYAVTAKHVFLYDTANFIGIQRGVRMIRNTERSQVDGTLLYGLPQSKYLFFHSDSLVDLALIDLSLNFKFSKPPEEYHWFNQSDILTKKELKMLIPRQEVFYIGLYPDSLFSHEMWYWHPKGKLKSIQKPILVTDSNKNFSFKTEILLDIESKKGVSGSPVFIKIKDKWKILGIINGHNEDNTFCTPAYRILEIIEANRKQRKN